MKVIDVKKNDTELKFSLILEDKTEMKFNLQKLRDVLKLSKIAKKLGFSKTDLRADGTFDLNKFIGREI